MVEYQDEQGAWQQALQEPSVKDFWWGNYWVDEHEPPRPWMGGREITYIAVPAHIKRAYEELLLADRRFTIADMARGDNGD